MIDSTRGEVATSEDGRTPSGRAVPAALVAALLVAAVGAVLLAAGAMIPVVDGAKPGFSAAPLLTVLAAAPVLLSGCALLRKRPGAAAGVLIGVAIAAPARLVLDLQFVVDPSVSARPELYSPDDLAAHAPATGVWLLLAGHAVMAVAGVLALRATGHPAVGGGAVGSPLPVAGPEAEDRDRSHGGVAGPGGMAADVAETNPERRWRRQGLLVAVSAAVVAGCGLVMAPFESDDVYVLARNAFEGSPVVLAGVLLLACALPLGVALLLTSERPVDVARGGIAGVATAVVAVAVPAVATGVAVESAGVSAGPVIASVAAAALFAVAASRPRGDHMVPVNDEGGDVAGEASVPSRRRLEHTTGMFAVVTAALAVAGSVTAQLSMKTAGPVPESPHRWVLLAAGGLVGVLGLAMVVPTVASVVRSVLSVTWAGVVLAATAVLDTAVTATQLPGASSTGPGALWAWLAVCAAGLTACCCTVTGLVEREDADLPDGAARATARPGAGLVLMLGTAAILAVGAFALPVVVAPDYVEPGLWSHVGTPSWGLGTALAVMLGALVLAPRSRPSRAAGMLVGVACLAGLRAAALPLGSAHIDGAHAGPGLWFALATAAVVVTAAALIPARSRTERHTTATLERSRP